MGWYDNEQEYTSRRIDNDFWYMLSDIGQSDFIDSVGFGLATVFGANDESNWHWLLWLKDGTYAYAWGWCDYTGWGCQSDGGYEIYPTLKDAIKAVPATDDFGGRNPRKIIKGQLAGTIPYGAES